MTASIDPNNNKTEVCQSHDGYDWLALIKSHNPMPDVKNPVHASIQFLSQFISHESLYGDCEGAKELSKVLLLLQSVDQPASKDVMRQTRISYEYLCQYSELLHEVEAPFDLCLQFDQLIEVLATLMRMRTQLTLGVMCSYGQLNQQLLGQRL